MELNYFEMNPNLNNNFNYDNFNLNKDIKNEVINKRVTFNEYNNYWEPNPDYEKVQQKKTGISYDDILNSMNMISINGRLHFIPTNKLQDTPQNTNNIKTVSSSKQIINNQNFNKNNKNSFIYDKYFKNYQQEKEHVQNDIPKVPLMPDEIKRRLLLHRLKQIQERKRIEQIKSKKLLFDTSNIHISNQSNNPPNLNKLFNFSDFR